MLLGNKVRAGFHPGGCRALAIPVAVPGWSSAAFCAQPSPEVLPGVREPVIPGSQRVAARGRCSRYGMLLVWDALVWGYC